MSFCRGASGLSFEQLRLEDFSESLKTVMNSLKDLW